MIETQLNLPTEHAPLLLSTCVIFIDMMAVFTLHRRSSIIPNLDTDHQIEGRTKLRKCNSVFTENKYRTQLKLIALLNIVQYAAYCHCYQTFSFLFSKERTQYNV